MKKSGFSGKRKNQKTCRLLTYIIKFGNRKVKEKDKIDFFATSLPLLLVFEDDIQKRNTIDAKHLMALAQLGLGLCSDAMQNLNEVLHLNAMHVGAKDLLEQISLKGLS